MPKRWAGSNAIGASVPDGWFTVAAAAKACGRDKDTLRDWRRDEVFMPSGFQWNGQLKVYLYSARDIEDLKEFVKGRKPGLKKEPKEVSK